MHHITRFHSTFRILSPQWTSDITQPHLIPHLCRTAHNQTSHDHTTHISPLHVTQPHSISYITPPHQTSHVPCGTDTPPVNPHHTTHTTISHHISHQLLQHVYFISPQIIIMPHRFALPTFLQTTCWRRHKKTMDHIQHCTSFNITFQMVHSTPHQFTVQNYTPHCIPHHTTTHYMSLGSGNSSMVRASHS